MEPLILFAGELALLQDPETHYCNSLLLLLLGCCCMSCSCRRARCYVKRVDLAEVSPVCATIDLVSSKQIVGDWSYVSDVTGRS